MRKVLFISHDASRSGAPLYLLNLIKWIRENYEVECLVLMRTGGYLENEFKNNCTKYWIWDGYYTHTNFQEKIVSKLGLNSISTLYQNRIIKEIKNQKPDLVISNTVVSNPLALVIKSKIKVPLIGIYHEMQFSIQHFYKEYFNIKDIQIFDRIIAVNSAIKKYLISNYPIKANIIEVIPPFINCEDEIEDWNFDYNKKKLSVLFSGYGKWQKGFDLLSGLLALIKYQNLQNNFEFVWIGEIPQDEKDQLVFELELLGISSILSMPGLISNSQDYFKTADLFVLLSKEDSFPISCLEAAKNGVPILAFQNFGGIADFLSNEKKAGVLIPFLDLNAMVEKMNMFLLNPNLRKEMGVNGKILVKSYEINVIASQIIKLIELVGGSFKKK